MKKSKVLLLEAAFCLAVATSDGCAMADGMNVPFAVGLVVTRSAQDAGADYEAISSLVALDDKDATFEIRWPNGGDVGGSFSLMQVIEQRDLDDANRIVAYFHEEDPPRFPGSTSGQTSRKMIAALKTGKPVSIVFGTASGPLGLIGARKYFRGDIARVEPSAVPVNVLLNGTPTALPALHAKGVLKVGASSGPAEFWWLDQEDNALTLVWTFMDSAARVTRIDTPVAEPAAEVAEIAARLSGQECRAELYGIYFDTGSAVLLTQSMDRIAVVAQLLDDRPDWDLTIEGHTDDIGSASSNVALSRARAEAVRDALVTDWRVDPGRLAATGFGESKPVDTNDTLEGRAHNRRVELSKDCE